jgi:hypothetical protein
MVTEFDHVRTVHVSTIVTFKNRLLKHNCMQARTHQLLVHNKELLDHIAALVTHLQELERLQQRPQQVSNNQSQGQQQQVTMIPQVGSSDWHVSRDRFVSVALHASPLA